MDSNINPLVSPKWLNDNISSKNLLLLDASLPATADGRSSELGSQTIPGARFFDLKGKFSDKNAPFPNTIPAEEEFERECQKLGINNDSNLVIFDNMGIYSSPRVWWMFRAMGHAEVFVLDGGLPAWVQHGFPTSSSHARNHAPGKFKASFQRDYVKYYQDVVQNRESPKFTIVDARSAGRFDGTEKEPRKHLKSGHIPNSVNIPFKQVLALGKFKTRAELQELFEDISTDQESLVFSCGSGLTACIVLLAGVVAGKSHKAVYDGSWTEWAELQNLRSD